MSITAPAYPAYYPPLPQKVEDLDIPEALVVDLILRRLSMDGTSNLHNLSSALKLPLTVIDPVFRNMRQQQLCEVKGMAGNDYTVTLSGAGRALAADRFRICRYAGAAPVSLAEYCKTIKMQAAEVAVNRDVLRRALSDLIVSDKLLDQLGPAIIGQTSIFLYGPPGNGKTSLAERLLRVYQDAVLIPYAVEVDGQIIALYDPVVHRRIDLEDEGLDPRWLLCRRPCILVGGELVAGMLDLRHDDSSGIYSAPLQMKANNGIFIIDDFGRQLMSPRDLLNRWIVPLDRRVDYLSLKYGLKFEIPFEVLVVFATNLEPAQLADEAFLRRIHNKIYVDPVEAEAFDQIFGRVTEARKVGTTAQSAPQFRRLCLGEGRTELRACYPNDVCKLLLSIAKYEGRTAEASPEDLERAVQLYFSKT